MMWGGCWQRRSNKFRPYLVAYPVGGRALDFDVDVGTDTLHQNITAFDFQACDVNWIYWNGYNANVEADELLSLVAPAAGRAAWHADRQPRHRRHSLFG